MSKRRSKWPRRLATAAAILAVLIAGLAAAGKWWLIPAALRREIARVASDCWDGPAEIADVAFSYTGKAQVRLGGVVLRDRTGREWFRAESLRIGLTDWPSLHPKLRAMTLTDSKVTAHVVDGRCDAPLKRLPSELWDEYVRLEALSIERAVWEIVEDGNATASSAATDVSLRTGGDGWELSIPQYRLLVEDLRADAFEVQDDRLAIRRLTARTAGGRVVTSLTGRVAPGGGLELQGHLAVRAVDLSKMRLPIYGAEQGVVTGLLQFQAGGPEDLGLRGQGMAYIEGADLRKAPVAAAVLSRAGLGRMDVMSDSDIESQFELAGPVVTLQQTRVQLSLAAVDVEPGGTMNVLTGQMDLVAVVVLFENVRNVLKSIPLVSLMVNLTEQLSRFHVEGKWQDPDSLSVLPAPLQGVRSGSKKFLVTAARGGEEFGKAVFDRLGGLFDTADPNAGG